jgi:hypothetical protein
MMLVNSRKSEAWFLIIVNCTISTFVVFSRSWLWFCKFLGFDHCKVDALLHLLYDFAPLNLFYFLSMKFGLCASRTKLFNII